ncbi:MAG: hypothetical protein KAR85_01250 [Methanosarcinales archaeon]|nr:hypothetical protein [Methanosarcinales archaeon]
MNLEEALSATPFKSRLEIIKNSSEELFKQGLLHHKYFTIHGIDHSHAIISILNDLVDGIESTYELTKHEIFYLLASVYLHDVGMEIPNPDDEDTAKAISTNEMPFTKEDVIRKEHHIRSGKYVIDHADILSLDPHESVCVRLICEGHRSVNLESEDYDDKIVVTETIRVRFLATLLRFSDELNISYKRAPIKILEILQEEMPDDSLLQWLKHYYTSGVEISVYSIIKRGRITKIKIDFQYPDREQGTKVGEMIFEPIQESFNEVKIIFLQNGLNVELQHPHLSLNKIFVKIPDHISEKFFKSKQTAPSTLLDTKKYDDKDKNVPQMKQHEVDLSNLAEAVEEIGTYYEIVGATNASNLTSLYATSIDSPSILYYDLEENVGNESIFIPIYPDLTIPKGELIYTTESWRENIAFGGDKYTIIDRNATNWIIARKLIDEIEENSHLLRVGETIILLNGWSITVLEVNVEDEMAWLSLNKDGEEVNNQVVREGEDFIYTLDLDVPSKTKVLNFTLETVFAGMNTTLVKINSINLISTDTLKINNNNTDLIDGYIIKIQHNQIIVKNNTDIRLLIGNITNIIGNFFTVRVNEAGNGVALVKQIVLQ